jgi:uncharacterized protein YndB with AHSA1/START domain
MHWVRHHDRYEDARQADRCREHSHSAEEQAMTPKVPLKVSYPSDTELRVERSFQAPRRRVFEAMARPELVKQWLYGPEDWPLAECDIDFRVGGKYRYVWRNKEKGDMGMGGIFKEIAAPERIVHTELFDQDWTGGETVQVTRFDERDGRTTVTVTVRYSSKQAREGALKTGMIDGWGVAYDRLADLLSSGKA